jgi:hypothetical protein
LSFVEPMMCPPFEPNSGPTPGTLLPCICPHYMSCAARAGVVHSYIRNVAQLSRTVCEIPARNIGILRKPCRWDGKTRSQGAARRRQRSTIRRRAQGHGQTPDAVDLHRRDGWGVWRPAAPLATYGCPDQMDRTAMRHPSRTPGVVEVGFGG